MQIFESAIWYDSSSHGAFLSTSSSEVFIQIQFFLFIRIHKVLLLCRHIQQRWRNILFLGVVCYKQSVIRTFLVIKKNSYSFHFNFHLVTNFKAHTIGLQLQIYIYCFLKDTLFLNSRFRLTAKLKGRDYTCCLDVSLHAASHIWWWAILWLNLTTHLLGTLVYM